MRHDRRPFQSQRRDRFGDCLYAIDARLQMVVLLICGASHCHPRRIRAKRCGWIERRKRG